MLLAFLRRNEFLNLVGKEYHSDFIIIRDGGIGKGRGNLGNHFPLFLTNGSKQTAS